jgi:DNA repair exonuclease SbcCD ATPase subunit
MTSMASQLDSLSFINEGSTKRKEFLAKFLDLEIFDKKFKMAKEESALTKAALRRLEHIDFESQIASIKKEILQSTLSIENNKAKCVTLKDDIEQTNTHIKELQEKIDSVPSEVIDPVRTLTLIREKQDQILILNSQKTKNLKALQSSEEKFKKIDEFLSSFDVEEYFEKKATIEAHKSEMVKLLAESRKNSDLIVFNRNKQQLLEDVPCGTKYPGCKFIKDAHASVELVQIAESSMNQITKKTNELNAAIESLEPVIVDEYISKYNLLLNKKSELATSMADNRLVIEKSEGALFKEQIELEKLKAKNAEYETNRELIENLKELLLEKEEATNLSILKKSSLEECENKIMFLHKKHGSLEQKLDHILEQAKEYELLKEDFAAYHLLMTCCHPSGVSYEVIKERLPIINEEIAKILTNIVEFEIFITNNEDKLDIFIKHPQFDPRPLEMGSGAEKTIASMALRLAFLTVSNLPKSDIFILDEPGTALDEDNMEGFVRILDMVKGYFKTVILISHLDSLKDCVDMQINIEKKDGFAYVNI